MLLMKLNFLKYIGFIESGTSAGSTCFPKYYAASSYPEGDVTELNTTQGATTQKYETKMCKILFNIAFQSYDKRSERTKRVCKSVEVFINMKRMNLGK